ncbi:hypothetical protein K8Q94_02735 [Candidatus Nomurabacteria bacterium]|nr:hypothetical protein [Candidatus Nomurabacteria bacterium]
MDRKKLLIRITSLIFFIFILNFLANKLYWYSSIWYFDMIMHFLGGFWLSLALIWVFKVKEISLKIVTRLLLGVLLIGVGWEVFEVLVNNLLAQNPFYALDTFSDICFDLAGGSTAILYVIKRVIIVFKKEV